MANRYGYCRVGGSTKIVSAVGAGMGRLQVAETASLLVTIVLHDRLALVGDNIAVLGAWVLLPDFCRSDVDANG